MKNIHPFFVIGTVGLLITATLHIGMTFYIIKSLSHAAYLNIYPVFVVFLILGTILTFKKQKLSDQ